jgi:hypothetical protein
MSTHPIGDHHQALAGGVHLVGSAEQTEVLILGAHQTNVGLEHDLQDKTLVQIRARLCHRNGFRH